MEPYLAKTKSTSRKHLDPSDKYARFIEHISLGPSASWKLVWLSVGSDRTYNIPFMAVHRIRRLLRIPTAQCCKRGILVLS